MSFRLILTDVPICYHMFLHLYIIYIYQHGLELVLRSNSMWQTFSSRLTYHTAQEIPEPDSTGLAMDKIQNVTCLKNYPSLLTDKFILLCLPIREYLPSSGNLTNNQMHLTPLMHSKMIHYKGNWKQQHMQRDYETILTFDPKDVNSYRPKIVQQYTKHIVDSSCVLPCCDVIESCQKPTLLLPLAQCHRQLFKYRWIERVYLNKHEQANSLK